MLISQRGKFKRYYFYSKRGDPPSELENNISKVLLDTPTYRNSPETTQSWRRVMDLQVVSGHSET